MPTIYTKEEIDKLLAEINALHLKLGSTTAVEIMNVFHKVETIYNELFSLIANGKNRIDKIDQDIKGIEKALKDAIANFEKSKKVIEKYESKGTVSPYARSNVD